jgi:single-strand selective monofunctional uracil DNA glycosylase
MAKLMVLPSVCPPRTGIADDGPTILDQTTVQNTDHRSIPSSDPTAALAGNPMPTHPITVSRWLARAVDSLRFGRPTACVYNPLVYARRPHEAYLRTYAIRGVDAILLGMNPGPWGMAQTGVPFGEVGLVREFLAIDEPVGRPVVEHPRRPVEGFACTRSEVSGRRFWGWARDRYRSPRRFSRAFLVTNYCPLVFMEASGRNRTPDKLPTREREPLFTVCDEALRRLVAWCGPRIVIGVGGFAAERARVALDGTGALIGTILHPSPASPAANRGWARQAERQLRDLGVALPAAGRATRSRRG